MSGGIWMMLRLYGWEIQRRWQKRSTQNSTTIAKDFGEEKPLTWSHFTAERDVEFEAVLFVPPKAPHDLYESYYNSNKANLKLYVSRLSLHLKWIWWAFAKIFELFDGSCWFWHFTAQCFTRNALTTQQFKNKQEETYQKGTWYDSLNIWMNSFFDFLNLPLRTRVFLRKGNCCRLI
jgi:hypothetical protein